MTYNPTHRRPVLTQPGPYTGVVQRIQGGVYVAVEDGDADDVVGPCFGAGDLEVGQRVLVIETDAGPWVAAREGSGGGG